MEVRKMSQTPAETAEDENLKATVEKQKVTIQYLAAMTDVYIPEEEEEIEDENNLTENEENL